MKERVQNVAVGLTVIVALGLLAGMIVIFAGGMDLLGGGYMIRMRFASSADIHPGDPVHLMGLRIGKVTEVEFSDPADPGKGVTFAARIEQDVNIPVNARAYILTKSFVGGGWLELSAEGAVPTDPVTGKPLYLLRDGRAVLEGIIQGNGIIPQELLDAVASLSELGKNLNRLLAPSTQPATGPAATQPGGETGLQGTIVKLNLALDGIRAVVGDAENQANLKTALANLAAATARATEAMDAMKAFAADASKAASEARGMVEGMSKATTRAGDRVDELAVKLIDNAEKISALMTTLNKAAMKIESGEGTAGQLLNDPKLYNSLLEATQQLNELMKDFRELLKAWKEGGLNIRLK